MDVEVEIDLFVVFNGKFVIVCCGKKCYFLVYVK